MYKIGLVIRALIVTLFAVGIVFIGITAIAMIVVAVIEWIKGVDNLEPLENNNEVYH